MPRKETKKLDVTKYVGTKTKIEKASVEMSKYGRVLKIESEPIPLKDGDKLPKDAKLTASVILGIVCDADNNYYIGIDTRADKWLLSHGLTENDINVISLNVGDVVKQLIGKEVVCQKNENGFLEIA